MRARVHVCACVRAYLSCAHSHVVRLALVKTVFKHTQVRCHGDVVAHNLQQSKAIAQVIVESTPMVLLAQRSMSLLRVYSADSCIHTRTWKPTGGLGPEPTTMSLY